MSIIFCCICRSGTRCHHPRKCTASGKYMLQGFIVVDVWCFLNVTLTLWSANIVTYHPPKRKHTDQMQYLTAVWKGKVSSVWQALYTWNFMQVFKNHEALSDLMLGHCWVFLDVDDALKTKFSKEKEVLLSP